MSSTQFVLIQAMAHGRGIYMCDRPGPCYQYGKIIILSRVLCNTSSGETLTVPQGNGTIYVIKNVANILPYCVINKHQTKGNYGSTLNQQPNIIPAHCMSAEKRVLTQVRSALAQLSTSQQQNVLAKLGGGQAGKNPHENVFIFVSF